jgi:hypothetical protein
MQKQADCLQWAVISVALRVVVVVTLCFAALSFIAFHSTPRAYAAGTSRMVISGSASSSPSTGPAGTTITVNGSGWGVADGTSVTFGYQISSSCSIVADSQTGTLSSGSFSGWFRWPSGTALNTYRVCAMLGSSVMAVAGSFSVLSSNPPSVSISPSTVSPNNHATITANNYYPAGTQVNFAWMSGNTVIENLNSATSNTSGIATLTFTVPNFSIASGSYSINASVGSGQSPTLFSSTNFTYHAPVVPPSPTPNPSPTSAPTPSPTQSVTPTVTATASATATTGTTPTVSASPTAASSQTPVTNGGTTSGSNGGSNTGTPTSSSSNALLVGAGVAVLIGLLLVGVVAALLISRRRKAAGAQAKAMPSKLLNSAGKVPWSNPQGVFMNNAAMPPTLNNNTVGNSNAASFPPYNPQANNIAAPTVANIPPLPVGAGVGVPAGNGNGNGYNNGISPVGNPNSLLSQPLSLSPQPPAWLATLPPGGSAPAETAPVDPTLDSMRRQAQAGLFAAPRPFKDERS